MKAFPDFLADQVAVDIQCQNLPTILCVIVMGLTLINKPQVWMQDLSHAVSVDVSLVVLLESHGV